MIALWTASWLPGPVLLPRVTTLFLIDGVDGLDFARISWIQDQSDYSATE